MFDFGDLDDDEVLDVVDEDEITDTSVFYAGDIVKGLFMKAQWYLATITKDNGDGTYTIEWNDGDAKDLIKPLDELKLVRRAKTAPDDSESDAKQRADREAREREEAKEREEDRKRVEAEKIAREERESVERKAKEEREDAERKANEDKARADREASERAEVERKAKERADREALERVEAERQAKEDIERAERAAKAEEIARQANEEAKIAREEAEQRLKDEQATSENVQDNVSESPENDAADHARYERDLKEKSIEEQKQKAEVLRKEKEKRVLERAGGRLPGVRVKLKDMKEKPQMNGACGTLVEQKGERWIVNLDGAPGVGKGKWMVNGRNLVAAQWNCSEPKIQYSIVGSWNNWSPVDLEWDADHQCWLHDVTVGDRGWESFQFIAERDPNKCVHPDQKDASPHMPHKMCGPDFEGHGQNWAVGKHPLDKGKKSATYQIRLTVWEDEAPRTCEWDPPGAGSDAPAVAAPEKFCIAGTWNNWVSKEMDWDEKQEHFYHFVQLSSQGWESFQILLDGDYKRCIHPSISDANPFVAYTLSGPDNRGHGKNWTIGKHALDKGCKGARYKVRFFPPDAGRVGLVDWEPVSASAVKSEKQQKEGSAGAKKFCIAGTWGNWSANEMSWDEKRQCYVYTVRLGLNGWESFQILVDGDYKKCIHPDCTEATPHEKHNVCGPDSQGHGKNWTIGRHRLDLGSRGSRFEVRLYLDGDGGARSIEWDRVAPAGIGK